MNGPKRLGLPSYMILMGWNFREILRAQNEVFHGIEFDTLVAALQQGLGVS